MSTLTNTQKLLKSINTACAELGPDTSLRQFAAFLHVALTGPDGIDALTVQKKTDASQAATSRVLKMLGAELKLAEFFLDPADGRRRLARLSRKGANALSRIVD